MNRRGFLSTLIGGVAASAAERTFPFRVFSFPTEIRAANLREQYIAGVLGKGVGFNWYEEIPIGSVLKVRMPQHFVINPKNLYRHFVDREVMEIKSWNPRTEQLIVTRGS